MLGDPVGDVFSEKSDCITAPVAVLIIFSLGRVSTEFIDFFFLKVERRRKYTVTVSFSPSYFFVLAAALLWSSGVFSYTCTNTTGCNASLVAKAFSEIPPAHYLRRRSLIHLQSMCQMNKS